MSIRLAAENLKRIVFHYFTGECPMHSSSILSGFASTFSNRLLRGYGTGAIAAMAAAGKTTMLIGMIQMGICMGIQPLLAYNYGAKDNARLKEIIQKVSILTISVGAVTGGFCYFAEARLSVCLSKKVQLPLWARKMVLFLVIASPVIGLYYLSTNFVQASGCAVPATVMSVLRQGILLIPSLYLFHGLMGLSGIAAAYGSRYTVCGSQHAAFVSSISYVG